MKREHHDHVEFLGRIRQQPPSPVVYDIAGLFRRQQSLALAGAPHHLVERAIQFDDDELLDVSRLHRCRSHLPVAQTDAQDAARRRMGGERHLQGPVLGQGRIRRVAMVRAINVQALLTDYCRFLAERNHLPLTAQHGYTGTVLHSNEIHALVVRKVESPENLHFFRKRPDRQHDQHSRHVPTSSRREHCRGRRAGHPLASCGNGQQNRDESSRYDQHSESVLAPEVVDDPEPYRQATGRRADDVREIDARDRMAQAV